MGTKKHYPDDNGPPYRCGVGIVIFNQQGQVLGCLRASTKNKNTGRYENRMQWPQGGVDEGEDETEAAVRELYEELGIRSDEVKLLMRGPEHTFYDFPDYSEHELEPGIKYRGQRHTWFAFLLLDDKHDFSFDHHDEIEFEGVEWTTLDDIVEQVVPFKREAYGKAAAMFRHLADDLKKKSNV
ncbi:MAG: RNA pyrophosphohydrolase [Bdellovibrionales bacterium]